MHTGEDTARFLAHGYEVVAVEANPDLIRIASETFASEMAGGRLHIIASAIAENRGTVRFGISDFTVWSSLDPEMIARNETLAGSNYRYVEVPAVRFADVLSEHGVPYFLKVDIEGLDMLCVRALHGQEAVPAYVSIESHVSINQAPADAVFDELAELWTLGYRRFRYVEQRSAEGLVPDGDGNWEGPPWRTAWAALAHAQVLRGRHNLGGFGGKWTRTPVGKAYRKLLRSDPPWWDLHAALPTTN
jgi:FkbM family methyltransferase